MRQKQTIAGKKRKCPLSASPREDHDLSQPRRAGGSPSVVPWITRSSMSRWGGHRVAPAGGMTRPPTGLVDRFDGMISGLPCSRWSRGSPSLQVAAMLGQARRVFARAWAKRAMERRPTWAAPQALELGAVGLPGDDASRVAGPAYLLPRVLQGRAAYQKMRPSAPLPRRPTRRSAGR